MSALVLADTLVGIDEPPEIKAVMDDVRKETSELSQLERVLGPVFREREPERTALYAAIASFNAANRHNLGGDLGPKVSAEAAATLTSVRSQTKSSYCSREARRRRRAASRMPRSPSDSRTWLCRSNGRAASAI